MKRLVLVFVLFASPAIAQDVAPVLESLRPTYPTPMSKAQLSDLLNRAASQRPGWGMLRKDHGNNCPTPYPGISISCDWMVYGPTRWGYDILRDQESAASVVYSDGDALGAGAEVVYPWPTEAPPTPPAPPVVTPPAPPPPVVVPPPVQTDLTPMIERLDALAVQIAAVDARLEKHDADPSWVRKFFTNSNTYVAIAGVIGGFLANGASK